MVGSGSNGFGPTGSTESREGRPTPVRQWPSHGSPPRAISLPRAHNLSMIKLYWASMGKWW
eukprot:4554832-Pleurochrysis_carterae.AAC.1